ncbi:MAG: hypothetical protein NVS2B14_02330 [Chamaesiphon sp.]
MNPTLVIEALVIIIGMKNHHLNLFNLDFLKYSGIVPLDWELARTPVYTNQLAQVSFENGIELTAQPERIILAQSLTEQAVTGALIPSIATKYVQTLPQVEYQGVGINPRGYVTWDSSPDAASKYLTQTLLSPGAWQEVGSAPALATLNLAYTLEQGLFNLTVSEAKLQRPEAQPLSVALFTGNFNHYLVGNNTNDRLQSLIQILSNWQADVETYKEIINSKFLSKTASTSAVKTDLFAMNVG